MITQFQAMQSHNSNPSPEGRTFIFWDNTRFCHPNLRNADGRCTSVRRNGQTRTWKTRPTHFEIPLKVGFRGHDYITHVDAHEWYLQDECPNCHPNLLPHHIWDELTEDEKVCLEHALLGGWVQFGEVRPHDGTEDDDTYLAMMQDIDDIRADFMMNMSTSEKIALMQRNMHNFDIIETLGF